MPDVTDTNATHAADSIGRRGYLRATGATALGSVALAGCVGQATGTLATSVTDQPADIGDFDSLVVTIDGIWVGPEGAESGATNESDPDDEGETADTTDAGGNETADGETADGETDETADGEEDAEEPSGREYYGFDEPQQADLVQLQDGETQLVDERELDVGTYRFLQLDVSGVDATLADGGDAAIELPGNAPLTFNQEFDVRESTVTSFTADFAPVRRGNGSYLLRPVPRGIEVEYGTEADE